MAEFCDIDWTGYRTPIGPPISLDSSPIKEKSIDKDTVLIGLRKKLTAQQINGFTRTDDDFLMRFLHARKMKVDESYQLLSNYFEYRKRNTELFDNMTLKDTLIQQALYDGFPGVLANRDRRGRCVLVFFCNHWDHCNYSLEVIYRSLLLSLDRLLENSQNQINGFVFVVDWTDFSLRQSTNLSPRVLKSMIDGLQDCFPARFKGIHFVNQPWYVEAALAVIKPFLKDRTRDKIFVHGNNMSTLHDAVSKDVLPAELGGETGAYNPMLWAEQMLRPETAPQLSQNEFSYCTMEGIFPFINFDKCRISNTLFLDKKREPMHFVVCLDSNYLLVDRLIAFIKYCGGIAVSNINEKTIHSAVIVLLKDKRKRRVFTGDIFSAKYFQDCFNAKDLLDISKYRSKLTGFYFVHQLVLDWIQIEASSCATTWEKPELLIPFPGPRLKGICHRLNDKPSPLKDDFDYMQIIFYKTWSWLDVPKQFWKEQPDFMPRDNESQTSSPELHMTVTPNRSSNPRYSSNNNQKDDKKKVRISSDHEFNTVSPPLTHSHSASSYQLLPRHSTALATTMKRKEQPDFMPRDNESKTSSPELHMTVTPNRSSNPSCSSNNNQKDDKKKVRISSDHEFNTVSPPLTHSHSASSYQLLPRHSTALATTMKRKEQPDFMPRDNESKTSSPELHMTVTPNRSSNPSCSSNNNQKEKKKTWSDSDDELSVSQTPNLFTALLDLQNKKRSKASYVNKEKEAILRYILKHRAFNKVQGTDLWREMERKNVCSIRTWQSMKEHFRKQLLPNIESFEFLTQSEIDLFKLFCFSKE